MAREADEAGTPKPHLRRNLQTRFQLSDDDNASLLRYAQAWSLAATPLIQQQDQLRQQFRDTYPGGAIPRGVRLSLPAGLQIVHSETRALTLHYRDLLRNAMRPTAYDDLESQIQKSFGVEVSQPHKDVPLTQAVTR